MKRISFAQSFFLKSMSVTFPIRCVNSNCTKKRFNHISQSNTGAVKPSYTYIVIRWCGSCGQVRFVCFGPERERSWWSISLHNDWDHWPAIRSGICSRPRGIRDIRAYCWASYRSKENVGQLRLLEFGFHSESYFFIWRRAEKDFFPHFSLLWGARVSPNRERRGWELSLFAYLPSPRPAY